MALNAGVVGPHIVHPCRIQDIAARRMRDVFASRAVAALAPNIPLHDLFGANVVVDGMAAIASGTGGTLKIVWRIKRRPPIRAVGHKIGPPNFASYVPLRRLRIIVITDFRKVALLPQAPINERNLFLGEFLEGIRGEIWDYGIGILTRVSHHIGHWRLFPVRIDFLVAFLASLRSEERRVGKECRCGWAR